VALDRLTVLYYHSVFTQVVIWSIDSFGIPTKALTDPYQQAQQASHGYLRSQ
jgi:hypothetical protein